MDVRQLICSAVVFATACDKGSDSSGDESDADTDADTDTDTDADTDTDTDTDADTDTDTDADTDTDTDIDTDVDTGYYGEIHLSVVEYSSGTIYCDTTIGVTGSPYTGHADCYYCDFAFDIEATVEKEAGTKCEYDGYPRETYLANSSFTDTFLGFNLELPGYDWMLWGGYGSCCGTQWAASFTETDDGTTVDFSKDTLTWYAQGGAGKYYVPYDSCGSKPSGYELSTAASGAYVDGSSINCIPGTMYDLWSIYSGSSTYAYITVDTVDSKTAFDPRLMFGDSGGCRIGWTDNGTECTYAPTAWDSCPSYKLPMSPKSTYYLYVLSNGWCSGTTGDYDILIDTDGGDPSLTLLSDDANAWSTLVTSEGSIHIP